MNTISGNAVGLQAQNALLQGRSEFSVGNAKTIQEARKTAEEFEAVFIGQMLQPLFQNLGAEEPFGGGQAESMWRSLQVDEYGKAIAKSGGIGLADQVFREILKTQEIQ
jgi:Rod binding domain-containing protein